MNATTLPPRPLAGPLRRFARGASSNGHASTAERTEPRWARPGLIALLLFTAFAYTIDLSSSGYANSFYAAAVQAGTKSWKALFFGSIDSSSFITVDKPPASLWVMALLGRIFGFSSWSMLVPQALEGVAAVALLHAAVKRWFGAGAGLLAGALFAITPVAALMFRFNNPDALLVCLLVAGAYCLTRALEGASTRWVLAAGTMIGFAFLAKMMQAFLVLPAFGLVYLLAAPTSLRRRFAQMLAGGLAILISAGWWVAIVALWPAGDRPFIDGSSDNSIFNLIVGYNGLGRIFGASGPGGAGGGANFSGATGPLRLFNPLMGGQASWLLPVAGLALTAGLWRTRHAPRTDRTRAALLLWGGWLLVSAAVFSFGSGVIHTYYTVALVPAIAAPIAIVGSMLWRQRQTPSASAMLALAVIVTSTWSWALLDRSAQWESWLRVAIPIGAVLAVGCLLAAPSMKALGRRASIFTALLIIVATLSGPLAYSAQTIATAHTGSIPSAGPASSGAGMGGAPGGGSQRAGASSRQAAGGGAAPGGGLSDVSSALKKALESDASSYRWVAATSGSQNAASLELATGGEPVMAIGGFNNQGGNLSLAQFKQYVAAGDVHYYIASSGGGGGPTQSGAAGRSSTGSAAGGFGAQGGFSGTPPAGARLGGTPPLGARRGGARGGAAGPMAGSGSTSSSITTWVKAHYKAVTIGGQIVYDLTQAAS